MDTAQKKVVVQVQFWGVLGPLLALITLSVIFVKAPPQASYLAMATIMGVLASWKWKIRGLLISCLIVLTLYLYQFSQITPNEHLWHIGIHVAIVLGFVITVFAYQEVENLLTMSHSALESRLADLLKERESLVTTYTDLIETAKQEAVKLNSQHEKLLNEFFQKQHALAIAEESLYAAQIQVKTFEEIKLQTQELQQTLGLRNHELADARIQLEATIQERDEVRDQCGKHQELVYALQEELANAQQQVVNAQERQMEDQETLEHLQHELVRCESIIAEHHPDSAPAWRRKLEGINNQLREQFNEKSLILDETRKELFCVTEQCAHLERQFEESHQEAVGEMEKYVANIIRESKEAVEGFEREVESLQGLVTDLMKPGKAFGLHAL